MVRKYINKKVNTNDGEFDSKRELNRWNELKVLEKHKKITDLRRQVAYTCIVNGHTICKYISDFVYYDLESKKEVVEDVKSVMTRKLPVYRLKKKLLKACHGIDIIEIL